LAINREHRESIPVEGGRATLNPPRDEKRPYWIINWIDDDGKKRSTSGGKTEHTARLKAKQVIDDYLPPHLSKGAQAPTWNHAVSQFLESNRERWSPRTYDNYSYVVKAFLQEFGSKRVSQLSPEMIASVKIQHLNREGRKKVRSLIRGSLKPHQGFIMIDVELLAKSVKLEGSKAAERDVAVDRGDIAPADLVNASILCAASTLQKDPRKATQPFEAPEHRVGSHKEHKSTPGHFADGLPPAVVERHFRGTPKHYSSEAIERRREADRIEGAELWSRVALAIALAAGGGLRQGELLALRPRHFFTKEELPLVIGTIQMPETGLMWMGYTGKVQIEEQASQASKGKIWITRPKNRKPRTVMLPALLPPIGGSRETTRTQLAMLLPEYAKEGISLWTMTPRVARSCWEAGFPPLNYLLWLRMRAIWESKPIRSITNKQARIRAFQDCLLFPTRNPARQTKSGEPAVQSEPGWKHRLAVPDGTGNYQSASNWAQRFINPLLDYVGDHLDSAPAHRMNVEGQRKGWTMHAFRHYAISCWISSKARIPLPEIADQAGHSNIGFTYTRYAHALRDSETTARGFEY